MGGRLPLLTALTTAIVAAATPAGAAAVEGQGCHDAGVAPTVAWERLRNPILALDDRAVKDATLRATGEGTWHLFASDIVDGPDRARFRVSRWTTTDLTGLDQPESTWDDPDIGGFASPDVTRFPDGRYAVVLNSHTTDVDGTEEDLYVRTGRALDRLGAPARLAHDVHPGDDERTIDAALAHAEVGLIVGYKLDQTFEVAYSASGSPDGPFEVIGQPDVVGAAAGTPEYAGIENYQFLRIDGAWHLLATSIPSIPVLVERGARTGTGVGVDTPQHHTLLFRLDGDPATPGGWLDWSAPTELVVPEEEWNSPQDASSDYERQNAAFLCDLTDVDGYWYLLYAGSRELGAFDGRGHAALGIARSTDLRTWQVPDGTPAPEQGGSSVPHEAGDHDPPADELPRTGAGTAAAALAILGVAALVTRQRRRRT